MPPRGVKKGSKRARQYEHIKDSALERGESEDTAEEIAARTVNKERARSGEAREPSKLSREDISSSRRGGLRSHRKGPRGRTRDQLYEEAKARNVRGRSKMTKAELQRALGERHLTYGVKAGDFPLSKEAYLWAMEKHLGEEFTPELKQTWSAAFDALLQAMVDATES